MEMRTQHHDPYGARRASTISLGPHRSVLNNASCGLAAQRTAWSRTRVRVQTDVDQPPPRREMSIIPRPHHIARPVSSRL
jgi:hypothetical protein